MRQKSLFTLGLCLLMGLGVFAQESKKADKVDLSKEIKLESTVRYGKLANGMTYYIKANKTPEKKAEFQIVTNSGSILETDEEVGLAHFTEHMAFNGTLQFPGNSLIDELQKEGITFGRDINAYTGFDQTVYMVTVPTDRPNMLATGLKVLGGWANGLLLTDKQIDDERGVIIEEWRLGQGADDRIRRKTWPIVLKGAKYVDRLPIGTLENLENFKYETIRGFYKKWYRPDNQALVIVGDFDADEMEQMVKDYFSLMEKPSTPLNRPYFYLPDNDEPLVAVATDKEATSQDITIIFKLKAKPKKTVADFREQDMVYNLYEIMLSERYNEVTKKKACPFVRGQAGYMSSFIGKDVAGYYIGGTAKNGKVIPAINEMLRLNKQVLDHGFLQSELDRAKDALMDKYENASKRANKTNSSDFADQYVQHFLEGTPAPGARWEYRTAKSLIEGITLDEVNALAKEWMTEKNLIAWVTMPEDKGLKIPSADQITKILKGFKNIKTTAYVDTYKEVPFLVSEPKAGKIVSETKNEKFDFTTLKLSNGATVILKPTSFKDNEIIFKAMSKGGSSLYADNEMINAQFAPGIVDACGIGNMDMTQLQKFLSNKTLGVSPYVSDETEGFTGSCSTKDLETLLQYTYMFYTSPRKDQEVLDVQVDKLRTQLASIQNMPEAAFQIEMQKTMYPQDKRTITIPTEKDLKAMNMEKMYKIFKERFAGANDFTFEFVGDFKIEDIKPLVAKYIGGIPGDNKAEQSIDRSTPFAKGKVEKNVYKGSAEKATVVVVCETPYEYNTKNNRTMSVINEILQIRVTQYIREEMGAAYSPYAMVHFDRDPKPKATWMGYYGCSMENVDKVVEATETILDEFINGNVLEENLTKAKEQLINRRTTSYSNSNDFWASMMLNNAVLDYDMKTMEEYTNEINAVTVDDIKAMAGKYLKHSEFVKLVLLPESAKK